MKLSKRLRKWRKNITVETPLDYMMVLQEDIIGFADEVKALERENAKLRKLAAGLNWCTESANGPGTDCGNCPLGYDWTDGLACENMMRELGIEESK